MSSGVVLLFFSACLLLVAQPALPTKGGGGNDILEYRDDGGFTFSSTAQEFIRRGTSSHTDNWAVLVCTSRFWFNYRHIANTLAVYRVVKRLGMPDSRIILMLADDMACNPRNSEPGCVYANDDTKLDLYGRHIEVDYRGYDVTVENFVRVLTGRHKPGTPPSKRLQTGPGSNVLIYMTGHGGDEFLKFQDAEEISSRDLADSFEQMWEKCRYNEILLMADTCQAGTLTKAIYSPHIIGVGSSQRGENSYSLGNNVNLGVSTSDRFTYSLLQQIEELDLGSDKRLIDVFQTFDPNMLLSHPAYSTRTWAHRALNEVLVTDFFGATVTVETGIFPYLLKQTSVPQRERSEDPLPVSTRGREGGGAGQDGINLMRRVPIARLGAISGLTVFGLVCVVGASLWPRR